MPIPTGGLKTFFQQICLWESFAAALYVKGVHPVRHSTHGPCQTRTHLQADSESPGMSTAGIVLRIHHNPRQRGIHGSMHAEHLVIMQPGWVLSAWLYISCCVINCTNIPKSISGVANMYLPCPSLPLPHNSFLPASVGSSWPLGASCMQIIIVI